MFRRVAPLCAAAIILAACGGGGDDAAGSPQATDPPAATAAPAATSAPGATVGPSGGAPAENVPAALQFSAPLVGGGEIELGALAGRPVLLWFWAPW